MTSPRPLVLLCAAIWSAAVLAAPVTQINPPIIEDSRHQAQSALYAGQSVQARSGQYQNGQLLRAYWMRNTQPIAAATQPHYRPRPEDIGNALRYVEEVRNLHTGDIETFKSKAFIVRPATQQIRKRQTESAAAPAHFPAASHATPEYSLRREQTNAQSAPAPLRNARAASRQTVAADDICHDILATYPRLTGGARLDPLPSGNRPPLRTATAAPVYHSCLVRLTDTAQDGIPLRTTYSRRQAFNADNSRLILFARNGHWHLYDAKSAAPLKILPHIAGDAEPQWHHSNPDLLYYLPVNGVGMRLHELDTAKGTTRTVADFSARLKARWPSAHAAWTRWEGSPSADNRYWCFMVEDAQWKTLGVFTWDMQHDRITGMLDLGQDPDHVSMSPSGNYCVVSGDDQTGTRAYDRSFSRHRQLHHKSEHSDLALNAKGEDIYVSVDYQSNKGDVFMINLQSGDKTVLLHTYHNGSSTAYHFSGKAYGKPGWILVSTYGETPDRNGKRQWLDRKIFAMSLEKSPRIRNIAYAHSSGAPGWAYWAEPQATASRDFSRILFNSDWGSRNESQLATYMSVILPRALR